MDIKEEVLEEIRPACKEIRHAVFVEEQGFVNEFDEQDGTAIHFLISVDGEPAATARMMTGERKGEFHVGRVAVRKKFRKHHLGSRIMRLAEREAVRRRGRVIALSAQCRVQPFYESLGYTARGEVYLDEYCEHIHMEKQLGQ